MLQLQAYSINISRSKISNNKFTGCTFKLKLTAIHLELVGDPLFGLLQYLKGNFLGNAVYALYLNHSITFNKTIKLDTYLFKYKKLVPKKTPFIALMKYTTEL